MKDPTGFEPPHDYEGRENTNVLELEPGTIKVETLDQIKDHEGETYTSEKIHIPAEDVRAYVRLVGDKNPIHFDSVRMKDSMFAEQTNGKTIVPGFMTLSLFSNAKAVYDALKINEPHETTLPALTELPEWYAPVTVDSDISFKLTLKGVSDCIVKSRTGVAVNWQVRAYTEIEGRMRICMSAGVKIIYSSLKETL